ncbi:3-deoxy-D-arabino-heptulosonate-7-phosphate synthase, tyrosine-repressible [Burkholderiales bacterium]|nr:3-deoxy-D-arabino-heptulosonate-7-phosphate synthase, tyrosine-repressible [Burkholderiales bacterium]
MSQDSAPNKAPERRGAPREHPGVDTELEDTRVESFTRVVTPAQLHAELPAQAGMRATVGQARAALRAILQGADRRRFLVVGPCSVHDVDAALEYAQRLGALAREVADVLVLVMRVYFEKPRTTVGWKGLINDPGLDGTFDVERGLRLARGLLGQINALGVAAGTEALDPVIPQYFSDLVSWYAIGARTTESQTHREMASGLSAPVGFKNGTDGSLDVAVNAWLAALGPHAFLGIDAAGEVSVVRTRGNPDGHVVLRGGRRPNYDRASLEAAAHALQAASLPERLVVDCSHANSGRDPAQQPRVLDQVMRTIVDDARDRLAGQALPDATASRAASLDSPLVGAMLESNLLAGSQKLVPGAKLLRGVSVTDACIGWEDTRVAILAAADQLRRLAP